MSQQAGNAKPTAVVTGREWVKVLSEENLKIEVALIEGGIRLGVITEVGPIFPAFRNIPVQIPSMNAAEPGAIGPLSPVMRTMLEDALARAAKAEAQLAEIKRVMWQIQSLGADLSECKHQLYSLSQSLGRSNDEENT